MNTFKEQIGYSNAEYINAIEKYLSDKYSLSFKVESLGGEYGTADNTTVKAWCYCTNDDYANIKFMAEIDKENLSAIKDNYLHVVSAGEISKKLVTNSDNTVAYSVLESSTYSSVDKIEDLNGYLTELETYFVTTHFFVKDNTNLSASEYVDKAYSIAEDAKSLNLQDLCIVVWFVDDLSEDIGISFAETTVDKLYDTFANKDYITCHATIQLRGDEISTKREIIQSSIEKDVK